MASSFIVARQTTKGERRFVVRYRLGGRAWPVEHGGSFQTLKEACARRDLIAGELAAGRNPSEALRVAPSTPTRMLATWSERFIASRIDLDVNTTKNRTGLKRVGERFGERDPATISADEVAGWVADLTQRFKPGTVQLYLIALPSPARLRRARGEPGP
jgi:hypothetical protein